MTIALHTMVRNGRDKIAALLQSVVGFCDHAVILDTGSTDGTQEFLKTQTVLPVALHERKFVDFGVTRTEGMQLARGTADWLLLLDDDMRLRCDIDPDHVKEAIEPLAHCYMLQMDSPVTYWNTRLVAGDQPWEYKGVTHEYLDRSGGSPKLFGLKIEHHYNHGPEKFQRDLKLLSADIARDPYDVRTIFYLAQTLRDSGHIIPAIRYYEMRARMGGWDEEVYCAMYEAARLAEDPKAMSDAAHYRPSRAEPLRWLAKYYEISDPAVSRMWEGLRAECPMTEDILFVDTTAYGK